MKLIRLAAALAGSIALAGPLGADDLDSLFDAPAADVVTEAPAPAPKVVEVVRPFGTFTATGAGASDFQTSTLYAESTATVGIDARPDDKLRVLGSVETTLPSGTSLSYSSPVISELFMDYSLGDWAVLRFGQFGLTWGQARLVDNVGDLVSTVDEGTSAKVSAPLGTGAVNLVVSGSGTLDGNKVPTAYLAAGNVEQTWGPFTVGAAAAYHKTEKVQASSFVKTSWGGADWYLEAVGTLPPGQGLHEVDGVAGFLWQGGFPTLSLAGEYLLQKVDDGLDNDQHTTVLAASVDGRTLWGLMPKVEWSQAWDDQSGQLLTALVFRTVDHLTITAGVPWVYGKGGTRFVTANEDPAQRSWALGMTAVWSWSF